VNFSVNKNKHYMGLISKGLEELDDRRVIRALALRSDKDLELIKDMYQKKEERSIAAYMLMNIPTKMDLNVIRFLLAKLTCGNRDLDRDLDSERKWIETWQCMDDSPHCSLSLHCVEPSSAEEWILFILKLHSHFLMILYEHDCLLK